MNLTDIKKALYKQAPTATIVVTEPDTYYYETSLDDGTVIYFEVPVSDMGDAEFGNEMEAKHLIRWIKL